MYCLYAICLSFEEVVDVLVYILYILPSTKIVHLRTTPYMSSQRHYENFARSIFYHAPEPIACKGVQINTALAATRLNLASLYFITYVN